MRKSISWIYEGKAYKCAVEPGACPFCYKSGTVTELPPPLRAKQPDGTTHVCHPSLGGCNQGFAKDAN